MKYNLSEACKLVGCSEMTLIKLINKMGMKPLKEIVNGRNVKKLNIDMINEIKIFKLSHDKMVKIKRSQANYLIVEKICPTKIANNYKQTKYFDFFSSNFC